MNCGEPGCGRGGGVGKATGVVEAGAVGDGNANAVDGADGDGNAIAVEAAGGIGGIEFSPMLVNSGVAGLGTNIVLRTSLRPLKVPVRFVGAAC